MKKAFPLLLFFIPLKANAFNVSGESGFYSVHVKKNYERQVGYERWFGEKSGYYYKLKLSQDFYISPKARFSLSVTSGSTKAPFLNVFTSNKDKLFNGNFKSFNVENLYFSKKGFIWKNLNLKVGKFEFRIPGILRDFLWGGRFEYHLGEVSVYWNQIAGYEGRYFLYSRNEDDVDIANVGVKWRRFNVGAYRIMDAKGEYSAVEKTGLYGVYSGDCCSVTLFNQNGKKGSYLKFKNGSTVLELGYSQKGLTSYGYSEDVRDIGLLFKPDFSGVKFVKLSYSPFKLLNLYALRIESNFGKLVGNEFGGEVNYPFWKGEIFVRGAKGSGDSYGIFGGYRWGVKLRRENVPFFREFSVKNYLKISGEYADLPEKGYRPQLGFEGWERAEHVGYWHTTYKLGLRGKNLGILVSTGRNSKVDYLVWGNTADNFKYQRNHGKLWHFEELEYAFGRLSAGIQEFKVDGLIKDFLPGISLRFGNLKLGAFYHESNGDLGVYSVSLKNFSYALVSNGYRSNSILSFFFNGKGLTLSLAREWGKGQNGDWETVLGYKGKVAGNSVFFRYRVYSDGFSTYGMREFFRDDGLIVRPGEGDLRYLRVGVERPIDYKFSPKLGLTYGRLYAFSGRYLFQEFGISVSFNPCKRGTFKITGALGSNGSYYEGISFEVEW